MELSYKNVWNNLVLEITEEESLNEDILNKKINYINSHNQKYAIDDYGTGYNNISMVFDINASFIKIEGSFIRGIDSNTRKQQLTASIIEYCKINNIKVIAESVETIEELKMVKMLGVDYVQGYFVCKPTLEPVEISEKIKQTIRNA